jgi:hypothetical protein
MTVINKHKKGNKTTIGTVLLASDLYDNVKASQAVQITEEIVEYASDQL